MTDYAPRGSPDQNPFYTNQHLGMSHHCNGSGYNNYLYNTGQVQYEPLNASYSSYSHTYLPSQHATSSSMYMPTPTTMTHQHYQILPPTRPTMAQQPRYSYPGHPSSTVPTQWPPHQRRMQLAPELSLNPMAEIESQDSNSENMLSEPTMPVLDGYPDVHEFDELMKRYGSLHPASKVFADGKDVAMLQTCRRRSKTKH